MQTQTPRYAEHATKATNYQSNFETKATLTTKPNQTNQPANQTLRQLNRNHCPTNSNYRHTRTMYECMNVCTKGTKSKTNKLTLSLLTSYIYAIYFHVLQFLLLS